MSTLVWVLIVGAFVLLGNAGRATPRRFDNEPTWFDIAPTLRVSKKARGRGDVNSAGLTRRDRRGR